MTISKVLAEGKNRSGKDIIVYERMEKYARLPKYEIVVAENSVAITCEKTARTTWKKRFNELTNN